MRSKVVAWECMTCWEIFEGTLKTTKCRCCGSLRIRRYKPCASC